MTSRSKEKVAAAFRKLFRRKEGAGEKAGSTNGTESPARRLLRHTVQPVDSAPKAQEMRTTAAVKSKNEPSDHHVKVRSRRLMRELKDIQKQELDPNHPLPFTVELVDDNLFEWHVRLHHVDPDSLLAADMKEHSIPWILLHITFPDNYPFKPPFMRVVSPNIVKGFVLDGGAICMELLTPGGWASAYTIEAVIMQFAASLVKGQGRIGKKLKKEFNQRAAEDAFRSLVKTHNKYGWVTPPQAEG